MIYWTLGKFLKPLATINLSKSPTFLGNFCKGVKIYHFSIEIIFGKLLLTFGDFFLVTLPLTYGLIFFKNLYHKLLHLGRGSGQVVSVLTFYSDDPSSNPAEVYNFSVKERKERK